MSDGRPVNWQIIEPNWPYVSSPETKHGDYPFNAWFFRGFPMKDCDFPTKKHQATCICPGFPMVSVVIFGARMQLPMPSWRSWAYGKATLSLSHSSSKRWHHGSSRRRIMGLNSGLWWLKNGLNNPYANHGAGICTNICKNTQPCR